MEPWNPGEGRQFEAHRVINDCSFGVTGEVAESLD